jgi:hypothetical protein
MQKRFEIKRRLLTWEVRHNKQPVRCCSDKREAIRVALTLGRLQRRMGDDSEIILCDETGALLLRRIVRAAAKGLTPLGA